MLAPGELSGGREVTGMAESRHPSRRWRTWVIWAIPFAAAAAQGLLGWRYPAVTPQGRWAGLAPGMAAGAGAAIVLVLWAVLALVPLARKLGWRQALLVSAPAEAPFLLLFASLVPGIERAGAALPTLVGIAWALWALNAVAVALWTWLGRLPQPGRAAQAPRPDVWVRLRGGLDALLPFALAAVALRIHVMDLPLGLGTLDQRTLAYAAERVAQGQVLYRDVFAPLAPGPVYLVAGLFAVVAPTLLVAKALQTGAAVVLAVAAYAAARQFTTPLFALAAALLAVAVGPPSLGLALALLAVACAFRSAWSRETAWSLAGVLTGLGALFDPLAAALTAAALLIVILLRQPRVVRARMTAPGVDMSLGWNSAVRYVLVALAPVVVVAGYFVWAHALPDLWRGVVAKYGATPSWLPRAEGVKLEAASWSGLMATAGSARALLAPVVLLLGLLRAAHGFVRRRWGEADMVILAVVLLGAFLLAAGRTVGAEPATLPALLIGAHILAWAWQGVARVLGGESRRLALVRLDGYALGGLALIVLGAGMAGPSLGYLREQYARSKAGEGEYREVADVPRAAGITLPYAQAAMMEKILEAVAARTPALQPVLCLPDCPEIYFLSDRDGPTRFIMAGEFITPADDAEIAAAITGAPPALVIEGEGALDRARLAQTASLIQARYRPQGEVGPYTLLAPAEQPRRRRR